MDHAAESLVPFGTRLERVNARLAAAGVGLRLERRGERLGLRGPLPDRHDPGRCRRQRISLGLPATPAGLEAALEQLALVLRQLGDGGFSWQEWGGSVAAPGPAAAGPAASGPAAAGQAATDGPPPLPDLLVDFERSFFAEPRRRRQPAGSRSTWQAAYRPYLRRLERLAPAGEGLSPALLEEVLESYALASRSRQQAAIALAALAHHAGIPLPADWRERAGGYGLHLARFRPLPSDARILALVETIPNPAWRLVYGLMATYGLRNHEVFFSDLSALAPGGDRVIRVLPTSKTGEHQVWPFRPEWVDHFGLEVLAEDRSALPPVSTDLRHGSLKRAGQRVSEQFRRYELPITPYDLRHAWAVRTIHIGLPDTVAARMMGHSVAIHTRTYHHWITRRDQQQAVDAALARQRAA
ncbi:MAG: site-specific integrase [Cyanobacteriota bacterium]|nr:site-specific integrase [Cyanobacteriota bacterium]